MISLSHDSVRSQLYSQTTDCSRSSSKSIRKCSILERQDLGGDRLHDRDGCQGGANEDTTADKHAHGSGLCADDGTNACNDGGNGCKQLPVKDVRESSHEGGQD
jgi:hypothetical protein